MPLRTLGNWYFRGPAFGDPQEAFRQLAPRGLLDAYDEEQQIARGQDVQRQLRSWTPRSQVIEPFRQGLLDEQQAIRQQGLLDEALALYEGILTPQQIAAIRVDPGLLSETFKHRYDPFTLSADQERYGGQGGLIARNVPQAQREYELWVSQQPEGADTSFREYQRQMATAGQGAVTLGQGASLRDAETGRVIAVQPTTAVQERDAGVRGESETQTQQNIASMVRAGVPQYWAEAVAFGRARIREHEDGRTDIVDMASGRAFPVSRDVYGQIPDQFRMPGPRFRPPLSQEPTGMAPGEVFLPQDIQLITSVNPNIDASRVTSILGAAQRSINRLSDFMGGGAFFPATAETEADLRQFKELTILKLGDSATEGRRSNLVLEMLERVVPETQSYFLGKDQLYNEFISFQRGLDQYIQEAQNVINNAPEEDTRDVRNARKDIRMFNSIKSDVDAIIAGYGRGGRGNVLDVPGTPINMSPPLPAQGQIIDGWEFIGGDPANENNWRRSQ